MQGIFTGRFTFQSSTATDRINSEHCCDIGSKPENGTPPMTTKAKNLRQKTIGIKAQNSIRFHSENTPVASNSTTGHRWTFLTNHAHVLILIYSNPDMVLRQIAQTIGITERAVQRIVHELEEEGYLVKQRVGRRNHYSVAADLPLRHPVEADHSIGELLRLLCREPQQ